MSGGAVPDTMRAVRCTAPYDYRLEELHVPAVGPGDVLVKVEACGICASDIKCWSGAPLFWGADGQGGYVQAPVTAGHEFIGRVAAIGGAAAARTGLQPGERAIAEQILPCWKCRHCVAGRYWLCEVNSIFGFRTQSQGGMADYLLYPDGSIIHRVPDALPPETAALVEPLACSMRAVDRAAPGFSDVLVIAGAGTLGLGMVSCARLKNPGAIVVVDRSPRRLQLAESLGADHTINAAECDPVDAILKYTEGFGCDVFIEATGAPEAVNQGLAALRKGGTMVEFSVMREPTTTDWTIIGDAKELTILGSHLGAGCYQPVIRQLSRGLLNVNGIVTHRLALEDHRQGFELVHSATESIKVLLVP